MKKTQFLKTVSFVVITAAIIIGCKKDINQEVLPFTHDKTVINPKDSLHRPLGFTGSKSTSSAVARTISQKEMVYNTDFISVGVGGMRNVGTGDISLSGVSGTISKAYLYWHGTTDFLADAGNNSIIVNGTTLNGTNIGVAIGVISYEGWAYNYSKAYRADLTALVQATRNGIYNLSGFGDLNTYGASLIVYFNDGNEANNRDVEIIEGNDPILQMYANEGTPDDDNGWEVNFSEFNYNSGSANMQLHVVHGEQYLDGAVLINNQELAPYGHIFSGNSVPGANSGPDYNSNLWDIRNFDITSFLTPGPNTISFATTNENDLLWLIVALMDVPAGTTPPITNIDVPFDFKPNSCPNPFNVTEKGKVAAAILGTASFDVSKIDKSTVKLNGIPATQLFVQDVATPYPGTIADCNSCSTAGLDGIMDLKFEVNIAALVATLGSVSSSQCMEVHLTGNLLPQFGSTSIKGFDKIKILKKK